MPTDADAILLDIEGTTTPVDFVFGVLFPFAQANVPSFLATHGQQPAVQADLQQLRAEYDREPLSDRPPWESDDPIAAIPYINYLMACDRKSTGLKSLQGKIWDQGYIEGTLQSQLFADVKPAFDRWRAEGKRLYIFSSGSIQAQKLLFRHTAAGDLTSYLSGYFDTTTGPKREATSYQKIAATLGTSPDRMLFISDVVAELRAAQTAGMQTRFSVRPGNATEDSEGFIAIADFNGI